MLRSYGAIWMVALLAMQECYATTKNFLLYVDLHENSLSQTGNLTQSLKLIFNP